MSSSHKRRIADDRSRREHGDYLDPPSKMLKDYEAALERTRQRLARQREELQRRARVRGRHQSADHG